MASLSYYCGGSWMDFPYAVKPRQPKIQVTHAAPELVKFTLTDTDISVANALRRVILAEVPAMAIEIVNMLENDSVMFDEFIAHRMGLLPLSSHAVGDIPPDGGFVEYKDCTCFDGCPYCTVEFKLDVENREDCVKSITHFDVECTDKYPREAWTEEKQVRCCPFPNPNSEHDARENGILIGKLKKDQRVKMVCLARKGIPKYHSKWMPVATCIYQYQPIVKVNQAEMNALTLDEKIDFVQCCPRKVFELDIEDSIQVARLNDCIFCDECVAKAKVQGKEGGVEVRMNTNVFHFTVEAVTPDGPRSVIDVVRAGLRVFDYKMSMFLKDAYGDEITEWLPAQPKAAAAKADF